MKHINPLMTAGPAHLLVLGFLILPMVVQADPLTRKKRAFRTIIPVSESFGALGSRSAPAENTAIAPGLDQGAVPPRANPAPSVPAPQPTQPAVSLSTDFSAGTGYPGPVDFRIPPPPLPQEDIQVVMADKAEGAPPQIELNMTQPVVNEPTSQPADDSQLVAASGSTTRVEENSDNVNAANPYYSSPSESAPKPAVTQSSTSKKSSSTKSASNNRSSGSSSFFNSRNSRFRSSSRRSSSSCRGGV